MRWGRGGKEKSSGAVSRVLFLRGRRLLGGDLSGACHLSTAPLTRRLYRSTLQLGRAALSRPYSPRGCSRRFAGLRELSTSGVHSTHVAMRLVSSYLAFSPLPPGGGGCFLLHVQALANFYPLGSGVPCVARTFLSPPPEGIRPAASRPTAFVGAKVVKD